MSGINIDPEKFAKLPLGQRNAIIKALAWQEIVLGAGILMTKRNLRTPLLKRNRKR